MESEKKRSDEYWMGVRDSLRMVDSFIKWARRNEDRAKTLDDFIHDGLVAAAKRCESCLKDDLGLRFAEDELQSDVTETEHVPSGYEIGSTMEVPSDETFEVTTEDESPEPSEVLIETESESISIDAVGRLEEEMIKELSTDSPPREFSSDFELVEPTDLVVDSSETEVAESPVTETESHQEVTEEASQKPSFTWSDYERAITPDKDEPELIEDEEDIELPPPVEMESVEETTDTTIEHEPPEPPTEDFEITPTEDEVIESTESTETIKEPPSPPPPPESDEDEEERKRRARRLFFGD